MLNHVPNILTIIRFLLIPFILYAIIMGNYILAFLLLTVSGITDILDGWIARKFDLITNFGKLVDPLADKATQVSILCVLCIMQIIPFWILAIVFLKEVVMIAGASFLYGKELVVSSRWWGKLATVLFYLAIVCSFLLKQFEPTILASSASNDNWSSLLLLADMPLYYLALLATLFSLVMYFKAFYQQGYLKKENLKIDK